MLSDGDIILAQISPILEYVKDNVKSKWKFYSRTHFAGRTVSQDVRIEIWFSFDSDQDAMLSQLAWPCLIHPTYADSRGLSRAA
jgi:hypothetical protein